jgi:leucyl aminopeptidase (aminopeptidase T)
MKVIDNTVKNAILIKPRESVLIVYDKPKEKIAGIFANSCENYGAKVSLVKIKQGEETKREPPKDVEEMMGKSDVVLGITTISLTHTQAVRNAKKRGARIATMPGITEKMFPALGVDYKKMLSLCKKLNQKFEKAECAHITTKRGTDISVRFKGRRVSMDDGLLDKPNTLHNLPAGEVGVAPFERYANGKIVVDICMVGIEQLRNPITIHVKKGRITKITGKNDAAKLKGIFKKADKNSKTIAEFAIGTNKKAKPIGKVLNDEKAYGTCHFAFGDNISLGGKNRSNVHLDGVVNRPTIWFDDKLIMKDGKLIV